MTIRIKTLNKEDESASWFDRLKQFLQIEPQNKEELIDLLRDAHNRELIDAETLDMIESAILFAQMKVRDIMLPKKQMVYIPQSASIKDIISIVTESGHSRFPVIHETDDHVIGILHAKDLLRFYDKKKSADLTISDMVRPARIIPESKRLDLLLSEFRSNRNHMAIVVDEYGALAGFVTLEDIIEQIIGEIKDEFDTNEESYIQVHSDLRYIIKAHTPIETFNEALDASFSDTHVDTIGGIIMTRFGYFPKQGETITIDEFEFKIIQADTRRIKLIECMDKRPHSKTNIQLIKAVEYQNK